MTKWIIGNFRKQPREELIYYVDYSAWLPAGETVASAVLEVDTVTDPPLVTSDVFTTDDIVLGYQVSGGVSGAQYKVTILATISDTQVVEREVFYSVEEF